MGFAMIGRHLWTHIPFNRSLCSCLMQKVVEPMPGSVIVAREHSNNINTINIRHPNDVDRELNDGGRVSALTWTTSNKFI